MSVVCTSTLSRAPCVASTRTWSRSHDAYDHLAGVVAEHQAGALGRVDGLVGLGRGFGAARTRLDGGLLGGVVVGLGQRARGHGREGHQDAK